MSCPISYTGTLQTARKPAEVFDYLADFCNTEQWDDSVVSACRASSGALGEGTQFALQLGFFGRTIDMQYELLQHDTETLQLVFLGQAEDFSAKDKISVIPQADGCQVEWRLEVNFPSLPEPLRQVASPLIKNNAKQALHSLKKALDDDFEVPQSGTLLELGDTLILPGLALFTRFGFRQARKHWQPVSRYMRGKHVVISGATSGLGLAATRALAAKGCQLTLISRSSAKLLSLKNQLLSDFGALDIVLLEADLSLMSDTLQAASRIVELDKPIDVLINNAGNLFNDRMETVEGLEKSFALLLLSPYLLTTSLQTLLARAIRSRVINVSSGGMYAERIEVADLENHAMPYSGSRAYARAKRGLVLAGEHWATQWKDQAISVHNMHPGWADTEAVRNSLPEFYKLMRPLLRTPEEGADTIIWLACASEVAQTSGLFWLDRRPHTTHLLARTEESAVERFSLINKLDDYKNRFIEADYVRAEAG